MVKGGAKFAGAFLLGMAVTAFSHWPPSSSSDWAAWVQAIGSIAAVGVAIYISWAQARNDRAKERERDHAERLLILEGPMGVLDAAFHAIEQAPTTSSSEATIEVTLGDEAWWTRITRTQEALRQIPAYSLPWWGIGECVLEMQNISMRCTNIARTLNHEFAQRHNTVPLVWRDSLSKLEACVDDARDLIKRAMAEADRIRRI